MSQSKELLHIRNLETQFFTEDGVVRAVDGVDLKLASKEILGIVGESGCGKSTLALSILRLVANPGKVVGGEIIFAGKDLLKMTKEEIRDVRGGQISMIFQDPMSSLNPVFTIGDQIGEAVRAHQKITKKEEILEIVTDMLTTVGIPDANLRFSDYPHEYSGGMRQRVMIAMALSCKPKVLIADEPTTSLDVTIQAQILDLMRELKKNYDSSIILITHNLGVVAELCEKVAVMYAGKIVEYSDSISIFKKPVHPYTRALIGSIPRIDIRQDKLGIIPGSVPSLINPPIGCRFEPRCEYAIEDCAKIDPVLEEVKPDHLCACIRFNDLGF